MVARPPSGFRPLEEPEAAWATILSRIAPLRRVSVETDRALGRVLADPILADRDMPPADRATMDGYAVRAIDVKAVPAVLRVRGEVAAGSVPVPPVGPGECVRIFTGANVPPGADAVVEVEKTSPVVGPLGETIEVLASAGAGAHVARRAFHAAQGDVLIAPGSRLGPAAIAVCAAVGRRVVDVIRTPRVTVLSTGAELTADGAKPGEHQTRDSNGPLIRATLRLHGIEALPGTTVGDDLGLIAEQIARGLHSGDAVVLSGGVSVGKHDLVPEAAVHAGARVHLHGVRMQPGKPFLFATTTDGKGIFGLPGNPLSVLTSLHEFVLPALRRMAGWSPEDARPTLWLPLAEPVEPARDRHRYVPSRIRRSQGGPEIVTLATRGSGDLLASRDAEGMVVIPAGDRRFEIGERMEFRPWTLPS